MSMLKSPIFFIFFISVVNAALSQSLDLSDLTLEEGFVIKGKVDRGRGTRFGWSGSEIGDFNGDGLDDIIIGSIGENNGYGHYSGAAYVIYGKTNGTHYDLELSEIKNEFGFKIVGSNYFGSFVNGIGDINNDGFDDIVISTPKYHYVIFGNNKIIDTFFDIIDLDGTNGFRINTPTPYQNSIYSRPVYSIGDINEDGYNDIIIDEDSPTTQPSKSCYVVFGKSNFTLPTLNLSTLNGSNGFEITGLSDKEGFGKSLSHLNDFNGDGIDDFCLSSSSSNINGENSGVVYVIFGREGPYQALWEIQELNGSNGFYITGEKDNDFFGDRLVGGFDFNADGLGDILVSSTSYDKPGQKSMGAAYVIFGTDQNWSVEMDAATLNGTKGFKITGQYEKQYFGKILNSAGDFDNDGFDDIIIGDRWGSNLILFGNTISSVNRTAKIFHENIDSYFAYDFFHFIGSAGDINNDGFNDLMFGSPYFDSEEGENTGSVYFVFGNQDWLITGLDQITIKGFNIYPNPFSEEIILNLDDFKHENEIKIEIIDTDGKVNIEKVIPGGSNVSHVIPTNHLSQGVYLLIITTSKKSYQLRVIKI